MKVKSLILTPLIILHLVVPLSAKDKTNLEYERANKSVGKLRQRIERKKQEAANLGKQEQKIQTDLQEIEERIEQQNARLRELTRDLKREEAACAAAEERLKLAEEVVERARQQARSRVVSYYKFGPFGLMNMVFGSQSVPNLLNRQEALRFMVRRDTETMSSFQEKVEELARQRQKALASRESVAQLTAKMDVETHKLESLHEKQANMLVRVYRKKERCLQSIEELEKTAERLEDTIRALQREMAKQTAPDRDLRRGGFAALKGRLDPPVARGRVVGLFGRERRSASGAGIVRNGIEIAAPEGTEIRSVYTGRVIYAGSLKGYGNVLILDHADKYYSLYAYASRLFKKVGNLVKKGEVVGLVGFSGSSCGECLYFEIRRGGKPENPLDWINSGKLVFN